MDFVTASGHLRAVLNPATPGDRIPVGMSGYSPAVIAAATLAALAMPAATAIAGLILPDAVGELL